MRTVSRIRQIRVLTGALAAMGLATAMAVLPATIASASTSNAATAAGQAYWTGTAPGANGTGPGAPHAAAAPAAIGAGCPSGITEGTGAWACLNSQYDNWGYRAYIRRGVNTGTSSGGWGWEKAWYYHNLAQQPTLDTIELSATRTNQANNTRYLYIAYHYNSSNQLDQEVRVVVTHVQSDNNSGTSPDKYNVGVYTAFCVAEPSNTDETLCPSWVNSSL